MKVEKKGNILWSVPDEPELISRKRQFIRVRPDIGSVAAPRHAMPVNEVLYLPLDHRIVSKAGLDA